MAERINALLGSNGEDYTPDDKSASWNTLLNDGPYVDTRDVVAHTPQPSWFERNAGPAIDMWRNAEAGLANATQQFNERAAGDLGRLLGRHIEPEEMAGVNALIGGVKAPSQPVRIPNPIKAYHGSPHDFDAFDLSKIGTGEGAQAYGHGLYFAESEPVAKSYRDNADLKVEGKPFDEYDWRHQGALTLYDVGGDPAKAIVELRAKAERNRLADPGYAQRLRVAAVALERGVQLPEISPGRMYEVALHATPEQFLDWDKPLSQQPQAVRDFIAKNHPEAIANNPDVTGSGIWKGSDVLMGRTPAGQSEAASKLGESGIPGIRYLDQGSRAEGKGTSNYVVWTPEIIEILRKYGIIGPAIGGVMANALMGGSPQQQQ